MPYIPAEDRGNASSAPTSAGELNYAITCLVLRYFTAMGSRYQQINDVIGALEGAKHEFYRRVVAPYEDEKIRVNGDLS